MPDPAWSYEYNVAKTIEENGFTRTLYRTPIITETTSGNPTERGVHVDSSDGDAVFLTSTIPALDVSAGATLEVVVSVSGPGDAGVELTFLGLAIVCNIYLNQVELSLAGGVQEFQFATAINNPDVTWRLTFEGTSNGNNIRIYRDGVLVGGPVPSLALIKPFQRVLWWVEGGAVAKFKSVKFYVGGAVEP